MMSSNAEKMLERINDMPVLDVHTHIDGDHACARGLDDILLYHMVVTELYSSGCPDAERLSENPSKEESRSRIEQALQYVENIRNTSLYWVIKTILKDIYSWEEKLTPGNWDRLDSAIRERHGDKSAREIFNKANIKGLNTEYWRQKDGRFDDIYTYSLEWAFFSRCQYGQFDTALVELENTMGLDEPGVPIPVAMKRDDVRNLGALKSVEDVDAAMDKYCEAIPFDKISSIAQSASTALDFKFVTRDQMQEAICNRHGAGNYERDVYANYIFDMFLQRVSSRKFKGTITLGLAAEPLRYETGVYLRSETLYQLAEYFNKYSDLNFQIYLAGDSFDHAVCSLIRETPNLSVAGYWWHCFFPSLMERELALRLEMLPLNRQIGFFSDAYCADWEYGKSALVKKITADVLGAKIDKGYYSLRDAEEIAGALLYDNANAYFRMK